MNKVSQRGFTLLEVLLVVAAIAILAGIVIFAVNPGEILAKMRNSERQADLNMLVNALYQYALDNNGIFPADVVEGADLCLENEDIEVCKTGVNSYCGIDLALLTEDQKYLVAVPEDPQGYIDDTDGSGYRVMKNEFGRIVACAPKAELGLTIEVVR
jgi:prepilin-type N-terminal cleavage/methylation domain-containing protein